MIPELVRCVILDDNDIAKPIRRLVYHARSLFWYVLSIIQLGWRKTNKQDYTNRCSVIVVYSLTHKNVCIQYTKQKFNTSASTSQSKPCSIKSKRTAKKTLKTITSIVDPTLVNPTYTNTFSRYNWKHSSIWHNIRLKMVTDTNFRYTCKTKKLAGHTKTNWVLGKTILLIQP